MGLKDAAISQVMKLMQNPKVMQVAMNPKVMGVVMRAMNLRSQIAGAASNASGAIARSLNLATREEVRELRRTIRRLEESLSHVEPPTDEE